MCIRDRYIDRADILWVVVVVLGILSVSSLLTALSTNLITLSFARILLSFSMPFVWPICAKITSMYSASSGYGYSTALYDIGSIIGLALTYLIMALNGSWRSSMAIASVLGFIYIPIVLAIRRRFIREKDVKRSIQERSYRHVSPSTEKLGGKVIKVGLVLFLAFFSALYTWGFIVNWLSTFLVNELKFDYSYIALYMVFIAIVASILEIRAGIYSDRVGGLRGKIIILYIGLIPSAALLLISALTNMPLTRILSITLSVVIYRVATPSFWSIVNEVIPVEFIGRFGTIYTLAGPLSGIVSSILNGYIVALTNSVKYGVVISSALLFLSILLYSMVNRLYRGCSAR